MLGLATDKGGADGRAAANQVLMAAARHGELPATLQALDQKRGAMKKLMNKMTNNAEGTQMIQLFLQQGLYQQPVVYNAMNDDASVALAKVLCFSHPMIVTNGQLRAMPEAAKYQMIKELTTGNVTWTELYVAQWINQHTNIPYNIPDYLTQGASN